VSPAPAAAGTVRLVLASASPARRRLLEAAGIDPEVAVSGVDEDRLAPTFDSPAAVALGLAQAKAQAVADRTATGDGRRTLIVGCDSVLEMPGVPQLAGQALGKPSSPADAAARWALMVGQEGLLHTGHCLVDLTTQRTFAELATTTVRFAEVGAAEIEAYIATGEPLAVAGAFTIDGLGGAFVRGIVGDWSNVVGLSLPLLRNLVGRAGLAWPALWRSG